MRTRVLTGALGAQMIYATSVSKIIELLVEDAMLPESAIDGSSKTYSQNLGR